MSSRKFESGPSKRKRKSEENKFIGTQKGAILRHFHPITNRIISENEEIQNVREAENLNILWEDNSVSITEADGVINRECNIVDGSEGKAGEATASQSELRKQANLQDIGLWPKILAQSELDSLIKIGPQRVKNFDFPKTDGRRFVENRYKGKLPNGDTYDRTWLVYSIHSDAAFCFPCKLFGNMNIKLTNNGSSSWKHLRADLVEHERSQSHKSNCLSWKETSTRLNTHQTIDCHRQRQLDLEDQYWRNILKRIIAATKFLAQHNLAFRGSSSKLFTKSNGNFLGLIEMMSEFDPVLQEHLRKISSDESKDHYLSYRIQNEVIDLLGSETKKLIISSCQKSKYFSTILDCTRDISKQEQLTSVIRYFNLESLEAEEHFFGFISMTSTTGQIITDTHLSELKSSGLDIMNCRGQSYDNGSNMKGCNLGVQARITEINPRAFLSRVPHSLNLVVCDAASSCAKAISFFGLVQEIYNFLSGSPIRWNVLLKNVETLTLKPLSETRWESRVDSLKTLKYEFCKVYDSLQELVDDKSHDTSTRFQASNLGKQMCSFQFMTLLGIWYDILFQVNLVSKRMQSPSFDISMAKKEADKLMKFFRDLRNRGISDGILYANEVAPELGVKATFESDRAVRPRKRKRLHGYEANDEPILDAEKQFTVEVFNVMLDEIIQSLSSRFEQLQEHAELFGFLFDIRNSAQNPDDLLKQCKDFEIALTHKKNSDIKSNELYDEVRAFANIVQPKTTPLDAIKYIVQHSFEDSFPNLLIALRILLTIPVTVAAGERSFSKLKLIKPYLRSTMSQLRLNGLAFISIESDVLKKIDTSKLIETFCGLKNRNKKFV